MKRPELDDVRAEFGIYVGYDLNNPHDMRIYSVQRDTMYMRNKFVPQPYVPNELNLKRRVEATLPSDQVIDMVKEQPYWRGSMVRPSTLHTPSSLVMGHRTRSWGRSTLDVRMARSWMLKVTGSTTQVILRRILT